MPLGDQKEEVAPKVQPEQRQSFIVTDAEKAARKRSRLRLMKERNEAYLAEQKEYEEEEFTQELRVFATK